MTSRVFNVWIEVEEVEGVDGCDMFYEDRSDHLDFGKVGRFDTLDEAVSMAYRLRGSADGLEVV